MFKKGGGSSRLWRFGSISLVFLFVMNASVDRAAWPSQISGTSATLWNLHFALAHLILSGVINVKVLPGGGEPA